MIISVHQPQFLPWLGYFDKINSSDVFVLLDDVQFKKNEWQNRNRIKTAQEEQWLTVPVLHIFGQKICDVKINNNENWKKKHLNAIALNYSKTPFYQDYRDFFEKIYTQDWETLYEINSCFIIELCKILGIKTKIVKSSDYEKSEEPTQRLVDLCKTFKADTYISGADGPQYMNMDSFNEANINIIVQSYNHPKYQQNNFSKKNDKFLSHMSIIDLLLNCGSETLKILSNAKGAA